MSLDLKINGQSLELPRDVAVPIDLYNPCFNQGDNGDFNQDFIGGSYSYPFTVSSQSAINQKILGFPEVIDSREPISSLLDAEIWFDGELILAGQFQLTSAGPAYEGNFLFSGGALAVALNNTKLADLPWGADIIMNSDFEYREYQWDPLFITTNAQLDYGGTIYVDVPFNTSISQTLADLVAAIMDPADPVRHLLAEQTASDKIKISAVKGYLKWGLLPAAGHDISPKQYNSGTLATHVMSIVDNHTGSSHDTADVAAFMAGTVTASYPAQLCFPVMRNDDAYPSAVTAYKRYINYYHSSAYAVNTTDRGYTISPQVFLYSIFDRISLLTGYSFEGSSWDDAEFRKMIVYNNMVLDRNGWSFFFNPTYESNIYDNKISLKNHVPDIFASNLINSFRKAFCIGIFTDNRNRTIRMVPMKEVINSSSYIEATRFFEKLRPVTPSDMINVRQFNYTRDSSDTMINDHIIDRGNLVIGGSVATFASLPASKIDADVLYLVEDTQRYYISSLNGTNPINNDWDEFSVNLYDYSEGTIANPVTETIDIGADTPIISTEQDLINTGTHWKIPVVQQPCSYLAFETAKNPFGLRFLFFRGLQADSTAATYPMATNDEYDYAHSQIGYYSMHWDGDNGLYNLWWKPWIDFLNTTKIVTRNAYFTATEIKNLDFSSKYRIENTNYIFRKVSFTLYKDHIGPATVEMLKV